MSNENDKFTKNLEDLLKIHNTRKDKIVRYIKKNLKENEHFVIKKTKSTNGRGGHNKVIYYLSENSFELVKDSFNLKHRYLTKINNNVNHVNILMSLENQTIGFIDNCFKDITKTKRQKKFSKYYVDLYFYDYNLVIECDENDHKDRNKDEEKTREEYILSKGNTIIRYDPNNENFDLSFVIKEINKVILKKDDRENKVIKVKFI